MERRNFSSFFCIPLIISPFFLGLFEQSNQAMPLTHQRSLARRMHAELRDAGFCREPPRWNRVARAHEIALSGIEQMHTCPLAQRQHGARPPRSVALRVLAALCCAPSCSPFSTTVKCMCCGLLCDGLDIDCCGSRRSVVSWHFPIAIHGILREARPQQPSAVACPAST